MDDTDDMIGMNQRSGKTRDHPDRLRVMPGEEVLAKQVSIII